MNYIDKIFERADLGLICDFLIDGAVGKRDKRPYKELLEDRENKCIECIEPHLSTRKEKDELTDAVLRYAGTTQSVYMEIGLQIGTKLAWKIYENLNV